MEANRAYARNDLPTAIAFYDEVSAAPRSDQELEQVSLAIDGLARFRAIVGLTTLGQEEQAANELQMLLGSGADEPFARLASQFWDQYSMTASARARLQGPVPRAQRER